MKFEKKTNKNNWKDRHSNGRDGTTETAKN